MIIEEFIIDYLANKVNTPSYAEFPTGKIPDSFLVVRKIDGGRRDLIEAATISIVCYAETKYKATVLEDVVKAAMYDIDSTAEISGVHLGGESDDMDTKNKKYCYEAIFNVFY